MWVLVIFSWDPRVAALVAAVSFGRPDLYDDLIEICERESNCTPITVHEVDAHRSSVGWRGQVRLGHLDPSCQPYRPGWATRGAFGLSAASAWEYMWECYSPEDLDLPLTSATVAVKRLISRCEAGRRDRWCP